MSRVSDTPWQSYVFHSDFVLWMIVFYITGGAQSIYTPQHDKLLWKQPETPTADTHFHEFNTGMHWAFVSASDRCIISSAHKLCHNTAGLALNMTVQTTPVCFSTSLISPMTAPFKEHHSFTRKLKNTSTNCPDPGKCLIIYNLFNRIDIDGPCLTSKKKKKSFIKTSHRIFIWAAKFMSRKR